MLPLLLLLLAQDEDPIRQAAFRLTSADAAERAAAEESIRGAGTKAVEPLLGILEDAHAGLAAKVGERVRALSDKEWKKRDEAMRALVRLGRHALKAIQEHENAPDPEVAWRVRAAMAEIRDRSEAEEKEEQARNTAIVQLLGELDDARAVAPLLRALGSSHRDLRLAAVEALALLRAHLKPEQADEAAETVLDLYGQDLRVTQKSLLLKTLAALRSPVAVRPLMALVRDRSERNANLKRNAIAALAAVGTPESLRPVVGALEDEDPYVRHGAFQHLARIAGDEFGYDPAAPAEANRAAVRRFQQWWERRAGTSW